MELDFLSKSILNKKHFNQKKPILLFAGVSCMATIICTGFVFGQLASAKHEALDFLTPALRSLEVRTAQLAAEQSEVRKTEAEMKQLTGVLNERFLWTDILTQLQESLIQAEQQHGSTVQPAGVWIEKLQPADATAEPEENQRPSYSHFPDYLRYNQQMLERYFPELAKAIKRPKPQFPDAPINVASALSPKGQIYNAAFRAVNLNTAEDASKNSQLAYDTASGIQSLRFFESKQTKLKNQLEQVGPDAMTYVFDMELEMQDKQ